VKDKLRKVHLIEKVVARRLFPPHMSLLQPLF
jgi:hypothetical protein